MNDQHPSAEATMRADVPVVLLLRGRQLALARAGWFVLAVLAVGLFIASVPVDYRARLPTLYDPEVRANLSELGLSVGSTAAYLTTLTVLFTAVCCVFGALIFALRSDDAMALFVSLLLVVTGTQFPNTTLALADVHPILRWLVGFLDVLTLPMFVIFFYVFPDGRFMPGWAAAPALLVIGAQVLGGFFPDLNPFTAPPALSVPLTLGLFGSMLYAQVYRYRRGSGPAQRQQTKWVVFGFAAALVTLLVAILLPMLLGGYNEPGTLSSFINTTGLYVAFLLMPLSIGVAILRYRLWDIDVIINRALVYFGLTGLVVGLYVLVVGGLGTLLRVEGNVLLSLIATGVTAVAFAPVHRRLQRGVNRLTYGERDDPYRVLSRLGQRLEGTLAPDAVLPAVAETVRSALKLPYVGISVDRDGQLGVAVESGRPVEVLTRLPLVYGSEVVGEMLLAPRAPGEGFGPPDRRLLEDLARHAGVAAHAVRLTADLRRSNEDLQAARQRLVSAREEERRRLRRDLHDGLGPALGGLTLKLDIAHGLTARDPARAAALLLDLKAQAQSAVADIRRLVHQLRPPALDELGLVGALREVAANYAGFDDRLHIVVDAPGALPVPPAAVEVAAYRIAQEGLTNVARHASARNCVVRLAHDSEDGILTLEVRDDGVGLPEALTGGVGLASMRERAAELGGAVRSGAWAKEALWCSPVSPVQWPRSPQRQALDVSTRGG